MVTSRRIKIWLVWLAALAAWEGAYRTIHWRSWIFPAPSHVLDATIGMLGARTHFGDSVGEGWPWHEAGRAADASQAKSPPAILPKAVLISGVRLIVGFAITGNAPVKL